MADNPQWDANVLKHALETSPVANLEKLIAEPGRKYREEFAKDYAIDALKYLTYSDVLPEDIRVVILRVLELSKQASDPFLGMNLPPATKGE